jgi:hypothetical protein
MASAAAAAQRRARPMQLKREEKMKRGRAIEHTHTHNNMPRARCVRVHLPPSIYVWPSRSPGMCGHFVPWSARSAAIGRPYKACIPEQ